ncbi:hypothetical protein IJ670_03330 [bacterium]|nr:hypothetical protein [bacterium]
MQKILTSKNEIESIQIPLSVQDIEKFYIKGAKEEGRIGLEYERLSLNKYTLKNASYESLAKILQHFARIMDWEIVYDDKTIIIVKDDKGNSVSLEPGMQIELSLAPYKSIALIEKEAHKILSLLDKIADVYDVVFVAYGISPWASAKEIEMLNKNRYVIMNNYLPKCRFAKKCPDMMRRTAGVQINIDYKNRKDCFNKLKFFNLIAPFMTALCANSPFEYGKMSDIKSLRAQIWRHTGMDRCNMFYQKVFDKMFFISNNIYKDYIEEILDVPMVYIVRDENNIPINGQINFREFMQYGYMGYQAEFEDYILHQSLCFPDIRLKNYIEIRCHDSVDIKLVIALCAFYKGLLYEDFEKLLSYFSFLKISDVDKYSKMVLTRGLYVQADKMTAYGIIQKLHNIALNNLPDDEKQYLMPIMEIIKQKRTPADKFKDANIKTAHDFIKYINKY